MLWLSRRLGYQHNQVYLWESGRRAFYWEDFENLCTSFNRPLSEIIKAKYIPDGPTTIAHLLRQNLRGSAKEEIRKQFSIHPSKLSRWLTEKSSPPFGLACEIMSTLRFDFIEFIDEVVGQGRCPSLHPEIRHKEKIKRALYEREYLGALAPALELKAYQNLKRHRPGLLAKMIGITERQETEGLKVLVDAGIAYTDGIYKLHTYRLNTTTNVSDFLRVADYWSKRAASAKKAKDGRKSFFGYRVFGISEKGLPKLRQALYNYYDEISEILKQEKDEFDHIVAIPFQTLILDDA